MKIAFIEPHLKLYGGIRRIVEMASRLHDRGHDVTIYHSDGSPCTWFDVRAAVAPALAVLEGEHDVVLYNDPEPEDMRLAASARARATFYYTLGLYRKELLPGWNPKLLMGRNIRTRRLRECLRSGHTILVNSTWMQRWLRRRMGIEAVLLIGGVNTDLFHPVAVERPAGAPFRVLSSGDRRPGKDADVIERALEMVRGDGSPVEHDTYHGRGVPQEEMAAFYSSADVFVDATDNNGGWNNPVAEAMACGTAVACARTGQVEDFAFDGETALLFPPGDVRALADCIRRLRDDDAFRARLADAALARVRTFDWDGAIDRFESVAAQHAGAAR